MRSQCGPPEFDEQDFSKFDFSRWNLDGLTLDSAAAAVAGLTEKLFNSEEWRQHFQATLPEFQIRTLDFFKQQVKDLQQQRAATAKDFEQRAKAAEQHADDFRKSIEGSAAPVVIDAVPDVFLGSVRVVSEKDPQLGLPGVRVRIFDPKYEKVSLVESITDLNGNAILAIPAEMAKERDQQDVTVQIIDPKDKPLAKVDKAICIRVGQTEERVVKVPESAAIEENKKEALEIRSEREAHARQLAARSESLRRESEEVLAVLDCRLKDTEGIVTQLEKKESSPGFSVKADAEPPQPEPPQKEPPQKESPSPRKRGKKSR